LNWRRNPNYRSTAAFGCLYGHPHTVITPTVAHIFFFAIILLRGRLPNSRDSIKKEEYVAKNADIIFFGR
jgi:hypothetical protein